MYGSDRYGYDDEESGYDSYDDRSSPPPKKSIKLYHREDKRVVRDKLDAKNATAINRVNRGIQCYNSKGLRHTTDLVEVEAMSTVATAEGTLLGIYKKKNCVAIMSSTKK